MDEPSCRYETGSDDFNDFLEGHQCGRQTQLWIDS